MHTPEEQAWDRDDLFEEVQVANVEDHRADRRRPTIEVLIRHPDLSQPIPVGPWYLSGSLERVIEACETHLPEFLCAMEARVPETRSAAFSPALFWRAIHSAGLVVEVVVSDCEDER